MYQALYRKYRPSNFNEVVGQEIIIKTLKNAIKNNKISHAYIFSGPRGTGKTSIAKIFAKTINCENLKELEPCNNCSSCIQINNKQDTDIIEIDAASNNGVDEIREIRNKVNLVPSVGKYKIYIIDEVHMLTTGAFNALLKTLEEPPSHAIFILATTDPHKIPATIFSRCQYFSFKRIPNEKIVNRLEQICKEESIEYDSESLNEIARLSDGGLRDSISMLDQVVAYSDNKITLNDIHDVNGTITQYDLKQLIDKIISQEITDVLNLINKYEENGKDFIKLTEEILLFFKNIIFAKEAPNYFEKSNIDKNLYVNGYENIDSIKIIDFINKINNSLYEMKQSSNPKLKLELLMISLTINNNNVYNTQNIQNAQNIQIKTDNKNSISLEIKEKSKDIAKIEKKVNGEIDEEKKLKLVKIKKIRINNTLALFNKKLLLKTREDLEKLKPLLLDPDYSKTISLIFDGVLKAVGDDYLIFVYNDETTSDLFNENIIKIETVINSELNSNFKIISTYLNEWNKIKNEFNSKSKTYNFVEENYNLDEILSNKKNLNEIEKMFNEIIEYN
ncbi:MAG: DNA polymerase III subunit gamma/tau [Bacilli bacterium]|nr:DNA polymerase III subunit gamma/tau [Bacilli bacterium]